MATQYSMSELLDQSVERLPFLRRKVAQFRLRNNSKYRTAVLDELCLKCCDNLEAAEILGTVACAGLMSGEITATTKFNIDPDKLERLFQILIEYLPKLLEILLPLFMQLAWFLLAFSLLGSAANAQQCDPATGQCHPIAEFVGKTMSTVGAAITPNNVALPTQYGQTYSMPASQSCNCSQAPVEQSYNWYPVAASTPTTSVSWSKSWSKVPGQPARNFVRRLRGK